MTIYTVTIVEDDKEVRERLASLINGHSQFKLLSSATDVENGLLDLINYKPNILLTDLGLPDGSGIEVIKIISKYQLNCTAMVISGAQDEHNVFKALEAGAQAYILKHDKSQKITDSILSMMAGGAPISPVIARLMLQKFQKPPQIVDLSDDAHVSIDPLAETLTEKQTKILKLVSQGFTSKEIAEKLNISYYTVTTHVKNIYAKLQVNSRTEALYEASRLGLLSD